MKNSSTSDNLNAVGLFPFLAVLLCTMGALLVLLVVFAQRVGQRQATAVLPDQAAADHFALRDLLQSRLDQVREHQQKLAAIEQQVAEQLQGEQERLSHLEEHARRLEHELAKLTIAAEQLAATEHSQSVDQEQAERELERLQQQIVEKQTLIAELRAQDTGDKSYAVVPYRGPHGTSRQPIYIECTRQGVVLHPAGIELAEADFIDTSWPGNPLAAVLRASREYLNRSAAEQGQAEPPDPYPVILIRPDAIRQYAQVRAAIQAWDADFGYEFVNRDWQLKFPELPDPQLARIQQHALMIARDRLQRLVQSAPSRYQGLGAAGSARGLNGGRSVSAGYRSEGTGSLPLVAGLPAGGEDAHGLQPGGRGTNTGEAGPGERGAGAESSPSWSESTAGDSAGGLGMVSEAAPGLGGPGGKAAGASHAEAGHNSGDYGRAAGGAAADGPLFAGPDGDAATGSISGQPAHEGNAAAGSEATGWAGIPSGSAPGGVSGNSQPAGPAGQTSSSSSATASGGGASRGAGDQLASIADMRGNNWAVRGGGPGALAIRRTIQVVVRDDRLAILPSRHATAGPAATGVVVPLDQAAEQISEQFVGALRQRIEHWGLAGSGLYWRPVLELRVGPEAQQRAAEVRQLLRDSGVEVRVPETARQIGDHARR